MSDDSIVQNVIDLFRGAGFEVREYLGAGNPFTVVGSLDSAAILLEEILTTERPGVERFHWTKGAWYSTLTGSIRTTGPATMLAPRYLRQLLIPMEEAMSDNLDKMKALALAATQGAWKNYHGTIEAEVSGFSIAEVRAYFTENEAIQAANAAYIAAANPAAVLELIQEITRLKADRATPPSPSTAPTVEVDVRYEFEKWMSDRGESAVYIGDGLYARGHVTDQAEAFAAGYELARAALASRPAAQEAPPCGS